MIAALLLTMWQFSGETFSPSNPSFLLVNASEGKDPAWKAFLELLPIQLAPLKVEPATSHTYGSSNHFSGNPDLCRQTMRAAMAVRQKLVQEGVHPSALQAELEQWLPNWRTCKTELFPALEVQHYRRAWDEDFGLVTDRHDRISLLIHGPKGIKSLRDDLADGTSKLYSPKGVGDQFSYVPKKLALFGSLPATDWDSMLTDALLRSGLSVLFLPHVPPATYLLPDSSLLGSLVLHFSRHYRNLRSPLHPDLCRVQMEGEASKYAALIQRKSAAFPGDHQFKLQVIVRQLQQVVSLLCAWLPSEGRLSSGHLELIHLLAHDLYIIALRGIAYGVAALGYHGYGVELQSDRKIALEMLSFIRAAGGCRRRDLQRKFYKLDARERDRLLARLELAGYISTEGRFVESAPLRDFLSDLAVRAGFPRVVLATTPPRSSMASEGTSA